MFSGKVTGSWMAVGLVAILVGGCSKSEPASQSPTAKEPEVTSNRVGNAGGAAPATKSPSAIPSVPPLGTQPFATPPVETTGTRAPESGATSLRPCSEQGRTANGTATTDVAQVGTGTPSNKSGAPPAISNATGTAGATNGPTNKRTIRPGNPDLIEFQPMVMDEPVTYMALTEDRRFLVVTHQAAGAITIWVPGRWN